MKAETAVANLDKDGLVGESDDGDVCCLCVLLSAVYGDADK